MYVSKISHEPQNFCFVFVCFTFVVLYLHILYLPFSVFQLLSRQSTLAPPTLTSSKWSIFQVFLLHVTHVFTSSSVQHCGCFTPSLVLLRVFLSFVNLRICWTHLKLLADSTNLDDYCPSIHRNVHRKCCFFPSFRWDSVFKAMQGETNSRRHDYHKTEPPLS